MAFKKKNFAKGELSAQLLIGGTSAVLESGQGTLFPDTGSTNAFRAVIWGSEYATPFDDTSREIVEAYRDSGDTFTITRAQESTSAKQWESGDNFMLTATAAVLEELEGTTSVIIGETPTGTINGTNDTFTLANTPTTDTVEVYLNGQRLTNGEDYTVATDTITMTTIPQTGDILRVNYLAGAITYEVASNSIITGETPSGDIDSSNVTFTLANSPVVGSLEVFLNGLRQLLTTHYTTGFGDI